MPISKQDDYSVWEFESISRWTEKRWSILGSPRNSPTLSWADNDPKFIYLSCSVIRSQLVEVLFGK